MMRAVCFASISAIALLINLVYGAEDPQAECDAELNLLQLKLARVDRNQTEANQDLVFVHVPCTFGHTVIKTAIGGLNQSDELLLARSYQEQTDDAVVTMESVKKPGGVLWGEMSPYTRGVNDITGCDHHYSPAKYWPDTLAKAYFQDKKGFAVLRDPYDKLVNDFRMVVQGYSSVFEGIYLGIRRWNVSAREGNPEFETEYLQYYNDCDVNSYLRAELPKVKSGDRFRANCHFLPQADFYEDPHGVKFMVDNRNLRQSFNALMEDHGYGFRMGEETIHNKICVNLSAYSLQKDVKEMIKDIYSRDFDMICDQFGYCDRDELTCLEDIPDMCGGKA